MWSEHGAHTIEGVTWWLLLLLVFAAPLVDSIVPVLPGEVVVAGAATSLAGGPLLDSGRRHVAAAGSLVGECVVLVATRRLAGRDAASAFAGGPKAARVRRVLDRWGVGAVVVARFLPGGRTAAAAGFRAAPRP